MKYIITEDQQKKIADNMSKVIKSYFSDSTWICDIVAHPTETDEDEAIFDIYIYLKTSELNKLDDLSKRGLSVAITNKVYLFVEKWFPFKEEDIYVGTLAKDC